MKYMALLTVLLLTACGFSPMYGNSAATNNASIKSNLDLVEIAVIPDREGQFLRNELIDRFYINGYPSTPRYNLSIDKVRERVSNFDITINNEATRRQVLLSTKMALKDTQTNEVILSRSLNAVTSYNVLESEFSTVVTEQSAREAALNDLARQIEQQVVLYLNR